MAEGTKLELKFLTSEEKTVTVNFKYAKPSATVAQVKALMNAMITNTAVFEYTLVSMQSAKTITTTETAFDLSANADPNALGIPLYEALKRGIISEEDAEASLDDYNEDGTLKTAETTALPPSLVIK